MASMMSATNGSGNSVADAERSPQRMRCKKKSPRRGLGEHASSLGSSLSFSDAKKGEGIALYHG
ncbi:hypothetical protein C8E00_10124 [Chromohalobacter marismortui]|uniref:Uncharacterized protein n=1 Tax=Chromohalobacter marismortui TaxID=42055 RepID=A0A4R7NUF9_9GAMM|nr:hypothetical protein C8E00_10124 [Chromohalobacter marismortui]